MNYILMIMFYFNKRNLIILYIHIYLQEWRFTCDRIEVGCDAYKDINWVTKIRRWPISLSNKLQQFLTREIPDKLKGEPGTILAPIQ